MEIKSVIKVKELQSSISQVLRLSEQKELVEKELEEEETKIDKSITEEYEELQQEILHRWEENFRSDFDYELSIMLRGLIPGTEILQVDKAENNSSGEEMGRERFYVTRKYGLKVPNCKRSTNILRCTRDILSTSIRMGILECKFFHGGSQFVNYSQLINNKRIRPVKSALFFKSLKDIYKILEKVNLINRESKDKMAEIKDLDHVWKGADNPNFVKMAKTVSGLNPFRKDYLLNLSQIEKESRDLLNKMIEVNKPFRILLRIKNED